MTRGRCPAEGEFPSTGFEERSDPLSASPESFVQPASNLLRQWEEFAVAIELDGFSSAVKHGVTVVALAEVSLDRHLQFFIKLTIQIVRQFTYRIPAFHEGHPRFRTLLNSSRNLRRPRKSLAFTAPMLKLSSCAVSSVERPSTSRK